MKFKKALLIYPPVGFFQRGEERCQADVSAGSAINIREPVDLALIASKLEQLDIESVIRDYPSENKNWKHYKKDLIELNPDIVLISVTDATVTEDLHALKIAKSYNQNILTLAKGSVFSSYNKEVIEVIDFTILDVAICGEAEFIINNVLSALCKMDNFNPDNDDYSANHNAVADNNVLSKVKGIAFGKDSHFTITAPRKLDADLDSLPYPKRSLINKSYYVRPDTNKPQATIQVSRGCPYSCIFCLSPVISGNRTRTRSVENITGEIEECISLYNIKDFFFRADTFTSNKKFVIDLCREIIKKSLDINWVANSRVDTFDDEMALWMKKAGCWLIAFGIESGNNKILKHIKKNTSSTQAINAIKICKNTGIKTYCFFVIGFPWDSKDSIRETFNLALSPGVDFIEIHIATPYPETELFSISRKFGLIKNSFSGYNYFSNPPSGTLFVSREELLKLRKEGLKKFYFRKEYIIKKLTSVRSAVEIFNYIKYGIKLFKNLLK